LTHQGPEVGDGAAVTGAIVHATHIAIGIAAGVAGLAMVLSWLRVTQRQGRGA
jgi:hypothetical protein